MSAEVAAAIDDVVDSPVLVVGSLPPGGRDLDLLASPDGYARISGWLEQAGFVPWRHTWARLTGPAPYAVELSTTQRWRTGRDDASCLFAGAEPVPGFRHLVTPGPPSVLLLAARGTVTRRGRITEKVRRRVSSALEHDPDAWTVAEKRARDLGMVGPLHLLRAAYESDRQLSLGARAAGVCCVLLQDGPLPAKARILVGARPQRLRPAVISFSGLDGSGKSTQVHRLQNCLSQLGVTSDAQWAGFKTGRKLRGTFPILDRSNRAGASATRSRDPIVPTALLGSAVGRHAWVLVVVLGNTVHLWRHVLRPRPGTKILVFDRCSPDTMVKLDLHFHRSRHIDIRWQRWLFARISPKPDVGFLVDVTSQVAYGRRQEQTLEELATMSELYREQIDRYRLRRLDGTENPDALAEKVALAAWQGLR